jgi:hypothetical protein
MKAFLQGAYPLSDCRARGFFQIEQISANRAEKTTGFCVGGWTKIGGEKPDTGKRTRVTSSKPDIV